jgi:hypothetical protein
MTYFTFHRELEQTHEDAMRNAVQAVDGAGGLAQLSLQERQDFRHGMLAVLDYLEAFWMGLEHRPAMQLHGETPASYMKANRGDTGRARLL